MRRKEPGAMRRRKSHGLGKSHCMVFSYDTYGIVTDNGTNCNGRGKSSGECHRHFNDVKRPGDGKDWKTGENAAAL